MTIALVAAGAAILGSLLTIFLTPWLQRHFWRKQRGDELRLATIKEFNRLATEYLAARLVPSPAASDTAAKWFIAFNIVGGEVAVLFSPHALKAVMQVDAMIDAHAPAFDRETFVDTRDAALRALYREVIPIERLRWWRKRKHTTETTRGPRGMGPANRAGSK